MNVGSGLDQATNIVLFPFCVLAAQFLVLAPLVVYALAPTQSAKTLDAAQGWLEHHNRAIVFAISLIFGVCFFGRALPV